MAGGSRRRVHDPISALRNDLAALKARVDHLSRSPRLPAASQRGGTQRLISPSGETLFEFGEFVDPLAEERYGLSLYDGEGQATFVVDELQKGLVYPGENHQWMVPTGQNVTSDTFQDIAMTDIYQVNGDVLYAVGMVTTPASTTAEVRIWDPAALGVGGGTSSLVIPANTNAQVDFAWLHPYTVGWDPDLLGGIAGAARLRWQVRRASGVGTVVAYPPYSLYITSSRSIQDANTDGRGAYLAL